MPAKYNLKNPAVKRILQEIKEIQKEDASELAAAALEEDIFQWHFVIRGPPDTEFEGGLYHGRIQLPPEYPFKPPSFIMLTPSGRFETGKKICLSISSHHPEHWQPSWSVRTALTALIAFMSTPGKGAVGSMDLPANVRKDMAVKSRVELPNGGSEERHLIIQELHQKMLDAEAQASLGPAGQKLGGASEAGPGAEQPPVEGVTPVASEPSQAASVPAPAVTTGPSQGPQDQAGKGVAGVSAETPQPPTRAKAPFRIGRVETELRAEALVAADVNSSWEDRGLTLLASAISLLIALLITRKLYTVSGLEAADYL